jgi:predicted GIY-YIG superfamily endonuclease
MPAMYILLCNDGTFYTGSTWDLATRIDQFERRDDAWAREKQIQ